MFYLALIISIIIGYLLGSIPVSLIISKLVFKFDIRDYGSGNMGGSNAGRVMGKKWGILVIILDAAKTFIPVLLTSLLLKNIDNYYIIVYCCGFASLLGHCYPIFAGFKGGKAVACSYGFVLATNIWLFLVAVAIFMLVLYLKKYVSLASMVSIMFMSILSFFKPFQHLNFMSYHFLYTFTLFMIGIFIIYRHKSNIIRLIKHQENKISFM